MAGPGAIASGGHIANRHIEGFEVPLHRSLTEAILLGGAPRGIDRTPRARVGRHAVTG